MKREFNVNEYVSVRLTDKGRAHHKADFLHWTTEAKVKLPYRPPQEDADGWSKWQLHQLMHIFGEGTGVGQDLLFETTIRIHHPEEPVVVSVTGAGVPVPPRPPI